MKSYIKKNKNTTYFLVLLSALLSICSYLFSLQGYGVARYFAIFFVFLTLLLDIDHILYFIVFCFPFSGMLKISANSITILPIIYLIVIFKILKKSDIKFGYMHLIFPILLTFFQLLTVIIYDSSLADVISFLLNVIFVLCSAIYLQSRKFAENLFLINLVWFFAIGLSLSIVLCEIYPQIAYMLNSTIYMEMTLQGRFAAMVGDANEYSQIVLVSIGCLIYSLQFLNTMFQKGISIILIVYLSIKGISSNSKSYVLTLFIMLALVILFYLTSVLKNKGVYSFIVQVIPIMIVGIIGLLYVYNDMILPVLEVRAEENTGFFTGRDRIWSEYSKALSQRLDVLFIGDGAGNVTFLNNYNSLDHEVPHNTYLEYLIQFGILGLISLIGTFNKVFKQLFENKTIYAFLPLGAFLITAFAISANASDCLFIVLLFIAVPIHKLKT